MLQDEYYIDCDFEEALDHYEQALKLSPDNIYTYWEVIELKTNDHFGGKFFEQAQGYLNYIVGLDPENCNHWFLKGCQELKMEKWEQAIQSFEWANQLAYSGKFGKDTTGSFIFKNVSKHDQ
jgi:tetratricopeptide (TPR) repeat protein